MHIYIYYIIYICIIIIPATPILTYLLSTSTTLHSLLEAYFLHSRPFVLFYDLLSLASAIPMMMNLDISIEKWWALQVYNQRQCVSLPQNPSIATSSAGWNRECEPSPICDRPLTSPVLWRPIKSSWCCCKTIALALLCSEAQVAKASLISSPRFIKSFSLKFYQHSCLKMSWTRTITVDLSSEP